MTRRVIGLDPSITNFGLAIVVQSSRGHRLVTERFRSQPTKSGTDPKGKPRETVLDRHRRLRAITADVLHYALTAHLVVIEGLIPSPGRDRGIQDRPALWWFVVSGLCHRNVPVAVCAPAAMKSRIVGPRPKGSGPVDKVEVALAVQKLWPGTDLGNADTADAAGLAHLGAVALGWDVTTLERHRDVNWTEWPEFDLDDPETGPQTPSEPPGPPSEPPHPREPARLATALRHRARNGIPAPWDPLPDPDSGQIGATLPLIATPTSSRS